MAFCTKCGAVMHDDDVGNHVCTEANIPKKGVERKPITEEMVGQIATEKANVAITDTIKTKTAD